MRFIASGGCMKDTSTLPSTLDVVRRRPLTPVEVARLRESLAARPEKRGGWEEEQRLSLLLERLPAAPVPDRFTFRVLAALDQAVPQAERTSWWTRLRLLGQPLRSWAPGFAVAAALFLALPAFWVYRHADERARIAASVAHIAHPVHQVGLAVQLPGVEILRDFEAINRMRQLSTGADEELLASLEIAGP